MPPADPTRSIEAAEPSPASSQRVGTVAQCRADLRAAEQAEAAAFAWLQQDRCAATVARWEDARLLVKAATQRLNAALKAPDKASAPLATTSPPLTQSASGQG